tara:strand:- start:912 stop:1091 length:180 start_codon:yes stop_codon:yes gene_type:complete
MTTIKNNYQYKIVRYYLDKMVIEIQPLGVTPTNSEDYPMYKTYNVNQDFKDIVNDLSTY